jgi:hypothetical protein
VATVYCSECEEGNPCSNQHLYVIQLREEIAENLVNKSKKGYLYVGSTSTSVEKRGKQNFTLEDGTYVEPSVVYEDRQLPAEKQQWSEDRDWKYVTKSIQKIRSFFQEYRPDLILYENPISYDKNDSGKLERLEGKLADKLRNRGWRVINKISWKSKKE